MSLTALVVVSYRSGPLLARNLAATVEGTDAVVVVVDSWSDAAARVAVQEVCSQHGWHLVPLPDNAGFGRGANVGVARAIELGADVVVLLNPDLKVDAATVESLAEQARREPSQMISPTIVRPDGRIWFSGGSLDLDRGATRAVGGGLRPDWLSGACLAISVPLWQRVGGFDPLYVMYWEDVDLSFRVTASGGALVLREDLVAMHDVGGSQVPASRGAKSPLYYRYNCRGRLLFAARHLPPAGRLRWAVRSPTYARDVVLRGGRRQLIRSAAPILAAARGTVEGLAAALRPPGSGARPRPLAVAPEAGLRVTVAHPSPDLYGSDRQLLETLRAVHDAGGEAAVVLPADGPLVELLRSTGASVEVRRFPVLRKSLMRPVALVGLMAATVRSAIQLAGELRRPRPDLVLVNTLTIPVWVAAAVLARVPVVCHVHEAEDEQPFVVRAALVLPLLLTRRVVTNSAAARRALTTTTPALDRRITVVHNGVPGPDHVAARHREASDPWRVVLVGRLSPRKGVDVALDAVGLLAQRGLDVRLSVCGTPFAGYEWYESELRERAALPDLEGRVELLGYVHPTWPVLAQADVVVVPSRAEPFGNVAVEGMLAARPVVASHVQGLLEVVADGRTGLLVAPGDPTALAAAIERLIGDDELREGLARAGRAEALNRFSPQRYRAAVLSELRRAAGRPIPAPVP